MQRERERPGAAAVSRHADAIHHAGGDGDGDDGLQAVRARTGRRVVVARGADLRQRVASAGVNREHRVERRAAGADGQHAVAGRGVAIPDIGRTDREAARRGREAEGRRGRRVDRGAGMRADGDGEGFGAIIIPRRGRGRFLEHGVVHVIDAELRLPTLEDVVEPLPDPDRFLNSHAKDGDGELHPLAANDFLPARHIRLPHQRLIVVGIRHGVCVEDVGVGDDEALLEVPLGEGLAVVLRRAAVESAERTVVALEMIGRGLDVGVMPGVARPRIEPGQHRILAQHRLHHAGGREERSRSARHAQRRRGRTVRPVDDLIDVVVGRAKRRWSSVSAAKRHAHVEHLDQPLRHVAARPERHGVGVGGLAVDRADAVVKAGVQEILQRRGQRGMAADHGQRAYRREREVGTPPVLRHERHEVHQHAGRGGIEQHRTRRRRRRAAVGRDQNRVHQRTKPGGRRDRAEIAGKGDAGRGQFRS